MIGPKRLGAQIDYRNLDDGRPNRVTDAQPVERYAFEVSLPYLFRRDGGASTHGVSPHLDFGAGRNLMVGLGVDIEQGPQDEASLDASVFWNPRRETVGLPAVAMAAHLTTDFGAAALEVGALFTRSLGRSRLHANGAARMTGGRSGELAPDWWVGAAWDYTLLRSSTLLAVEMVAERPAGLEVSWSIGGGLRRQLTPTLVGFAGGRQSLDGGGTELTLGVSHAFAVASLMPRPRRPR
ncbi:MAG: hypothetical protein FJ206_11525 [Gemmatimonadetes bacterium]|nr:hypothetical protein [Gemmatimonadota bacterium]